jgi:hypothetical protein
VLQLGLELRQTFLRQQRGFARRDFVDHVVLRML